MCVHQSSRTNTFHDAESRDRSSRLGNFLLYTYCKNRAILSTEDSPVICSRPYQRHMDGCCGRRRRRGFRGQINLEIKSLSIECGSIHSHSAAETEPFKQNPYS
ncbi:hypothetical protein Mapa_004986 [Marchantia paleacea]|nr:hypothetical protein Mapa_004986 [Marchantia paleacea]